jgi:hypothetical protein
MSNDTWSRSNSGIVNMVTPSSVNLGWNLAAQSTLATDTGRQVQGQSWPVGNGHHYAGTLSFPAQTADGTSLLAGARHLTLTSSGTDVVQRVFVWDSSQ